MKVIGDQKVFGYPHYSKYFVIVCVQQKKEIHTGLEHLGGDQMMTEFSFSSELFL